MPSSLNGTGVTFNDGTTLQSGNIPAANLGSGTANVSTVLRGNRTFGAPPAPTTAQVLSAYAGASLGVVGTYTQAYAATTREVGTNYAGSTLTKISSASTIVSLGFSGTWRFMGGDERTSNQGGLYLRLS